MVRPVPSILTLLALWLGGCGPSLDLRELRVAEVTATSATVRFHTDVDAECEVEYGLREDALDRVATHEGMDTLGAHRDHEIVLGGLTPSTPYFYRFHVKVPSEARTEVRSFTTLPAPARANVALGSAGTTVAAVSSNYGGGTNGGAWGAQRAIDGNPATEWATNKDGDGAFVELDLGQARTLRAFGFWPRVMGDGASLIRQVRLVLDGATTLGPFDTPAAQRFEFALEGVSARRVRVEAVQSTGGNTGAKEIELYE